MTGSPDLVTAVRSAKQFLTYVASGPFQYAVAKALALPDTYFEAFREDMRTKRDLLSAGLTEAGFKVFRPSGTYFITTDIRPLGAELSKNGDGGTRHPLAQGSRAVSPKDCGDVPAGRAQVAPEAVETDSSGQGTTARCGRSPQSSARSAPKSRSWPLRTWLLICAKSNGCGSFGGTSVPGCVPLVAGSARGPAGGCSLLKRVTS